MLGEEEIQSSILAYVSLDSDWLKGGSTFFEASLIKKVNSR
jgi:hypothetical protein